MANDTSSDSKDKLVNNRSINHKFDLLNQKMNSMYKDTYISRPDNKLNLDRTIDRMDDILDKLQGSDTSVAGMSELLRRVDQSDTVNARNMISSVQDLFDDQNIVGNLIVNTDIHDYIAGQNYNYDLICKYLPKLQDALEIKRDNVLCSDNLSKSFINPISPRSSKDEIETFNANAKKLAKEYDIEEFLDDTWMNTSKYGEDFIYIVPYDIAFQRLFKKSNYRINSARVGQVSLFENYNSGTEFIKEGFQSNDKKFVEFLDNIKDTLTTEEQAELKNMPNLGGITLHFNKSNMIQSVVSEYTIIRDKSDLDKFKSISECYFGREYSEAVEEATTTGRKNKMNSMFDNVRKENNKINRTTNTISKDGLILNGEFDRDPSKLDKDFNGAVVERIPRENIIPVYIGKKCFGYYFFEFGEDPSACGFCGGHHTTPMIGNGTKYSMEMSQNQLDLAIRYISSRISQAIDTKFVNANKDLKEEIYSILRYNEKFDISRSNDIGVTFIPAEDITHCYFKINEVTHRGISDLERAVIPAMLYILLYLTDIIGKVTRSTDKRVYYVKQNVETNIARTMMNVVQQIKKGNMGMRQIESMNNILNIVGKYNDYIIPMGPSGDPPIQFEVMPGQNIESPTELMEKMEEAAVNTIMPFEFVNATYQQDFATRFTMSNTRFLKSIFTCQRKTEKFFSRIYSRIYNFEFNENLDIEVMLPPPTFLTMNNNSQIIDNITQMADKIIESELAEEEEEVKQEFKKLYMRQNLSTYIDFNMIEKLKVQSKVNVEISKDPAVSDEPADMMDDDL